MQRYIHIGYLYPILILLLPLLRNTTPNPNPNPNINLNPNPSNSNSNSNSNPPPHPPPATSPEKDNDKEKEKDKDKDKEKDKEIKFNYWVEGREVCEGKLQVGSLIRYRMITQREDPPLREKPNSNQDKLVEIVEYKGIYILYIIGR